MATRMERQIMLNKLHSIDISFLWKITINIRSIQHSIRSLFYDLSGKARFVGVDSGARGSIAEMNGVGGSICFTFR
jgi:hypothetical protein